MELGLIVGGFFALLWICFLFSASRFMGKQREANRQVVARLEGIERQLTQVNQHLESANKMHGDLNRAAQWLVNRESGQ